MSASLVGSEMCIRDRASARTRAPPPVRTSASTAARATASGTATRRPRTCLLYTSDAADDM
eukprot:11648772-Alexandrium_andersonii.AAC.1